MSDKRSDILKASLQLISEHGFHGAPMSKVAMALFWITVPADVPKANAGEADTRTARTNVRATAIRFISRSSFRLELFNTPGDARMSP